MTDSVIYTVDVPVRPEALDDFRTVAKEMVGTVGRHPGHIANEVMEPADQSSPMFSFTMHFASEATLHDWLSSDAHRSFVARIRPLTSGHYHAQVRSSLAGWIPAQVGRTPPHYKSAIATYCGLLPSLLTLRWALDQLGIQILGPTLALAVTLAVSCTLMTWIVMPFVTKLLAPWLYSSTSS